MPIIQIISKEADGTKKQTPIATKNIQISNENAFLDMIVVF